MPKNAVILLLIVMSILGACSPQPQDAAPTATAPPADTATPPVTTAQCPAIVEQALTAVDAACQGTGRNQVCYGNVRMSAEFREGASTVSFERPGDLANLNDIRTVQLSPLDTVTSEWGLALMRVQANLPDVLPGQNVTFLLFGDVELENISEEGAAPSAFYFRTGIGDTRCTEAPDSGILVQTPEGVSEVSLRMNGVDITLGSTAYLQAQTGSDLAVSVVEGKAEVTSQGVTELVTVGNQTRIPMDADLNPAGPPSPPEPYDGAALASLPVNNLERQITVSSVLIASHFTDDAEDWTVSTSNGETPIEHRAADDAPDGHVCIGNQDDELVGYFAAPESWLGDQSGVYGGALSFFVQRGSRTDTDTMPDVLLEGGGLSLFYILPESRSESWTAHALPLHERDRWINSGTGIAATADDLQTVLANLTALHIRGAYPQQEASGCLDTVQLSAAVESTTPYERPPASLEPAVVEAGPAQTFEVAAGASVSADLPQPGMGRIESPGAIDHYTFDAPAGQQVYFSARGEEGRMIWTLTAPDSSVLFENRRMWRGNDPGILTLEQEGTYTITVSGEGSSAGTYAFAISEVGAGESFSIAPNMRVFEDVPIPGAGRIESVGEEDLYTFTLTEPQKLYFAAEGEETRAHWTLAAPDAAIFENQRLWQGNDPGAFTLEPGVYTIKVAGDGDSTGTYRFALWVIPEPQTFALEANMLVFDDVPQPGMGHIESPGAEDQYTLVLDEGVTMYFSALGEENRALWTLTAPDGTQIFENQRLWQGNDPGAFTLEAGTYTVSVTGDRGSTGTYHFGMWTIPDAQTFTLEMDTFVSDATPDAGAGNIESPGAEDRYSFTLDESTELYFAAMGEETRARWTLTAPDGTAIFENQRLWQGNLPGAFMLEPGTYTIAVAGDGGSTGTYRFSVTRVGEAADVDLDGVLVMETTGSIDTAGQQVRYTLEAEPGQTIFIEVRESDLTARWTLTSEDDEQLLNLLRSGRSNVGLVTLESGGQYVLTVSGYGDETGSYDFAIWNVPEPQPYEVEIGQLIAGEITGEGAGHIETPGAQDVYTFDAGAGQVIFLEVTDSSLTSHWTLTDEDETELVNVHRSGRSNIGIVTLERGGTYTLTVSGYDAETGTYRARTWDVPEPQPLEVEIGQLIAEETIGAGAGHIETPGAQDVYTFDAGAGQVISIEITDNSLTTHWTLTDEDETELIKVLRSGRSNVGIVTLERGGTYTLTVSGYDADSGTYRFEITAE